MGIGNRNTKRVIVKKIIIGLAILLSHQIYLLNLPVQAENIMNEINYKKSKLTTTYALRLRPGQDIRLELENFAKLNNLKAAYIITTVGSLKKAVLRYANQPQTTIINEKLEIVSLVGIISINGSHLHISLSDKAGKTIGAHLQKGSEIYTTAEIIIGELEDLEFKREEDKETTYKELSIYDRK